MDKPYREIPLPDGQVALVDEEDWDKVKGYKWRHELIGSYSKPQVFTYAQLNNRRGVLFLHKLIYPAIRHSYKRNPLDCRKSVLSLFVTQEKRCGSCRRIIKRQPSRNKTVNYCSNQCLNNNQYLAQMPSNYIRSQKTKYDVSVLQLYQQPSTFCQYENCNKLLIRNVKRKWYLCLRHAGNVAAILWARRKQYEDTLRSLEI